MNSEEGEVYVLREGDDEWVRPTPVEAAIVETLTGRTDLDPDDIDDLDAYVDREELSALLDGEREDDLSFEVQNHRITVDGAGNITVGE
jgi:hypothetical protein